MVLKGLKTKIKWKIGRRKVKKKWEEDLRLALQRAKKLNTLSKILTSFENRKMLLAAKEEIKPTIRSLRALARDAKRKGNTEEANLLRRLIQKWIGNSKKLCLLYTSPSPRD